MMRGASAVVALFAFVLVLFLPGAALAASPSTTTSVPSASTASVGDSVTDTATVTGDPLIGAPSGTVHFFVCGPPNGVAGCASGATDLGSPSLSPSSGNTAQASSSSFILTSPGTWCFRADYSGDTTNYDPSTDSSTGECFIVKATSTTTSKPAQDPITLGASNADTATVTGNAAGGSPSGTVDFYVCGPPGSVSGCATGGTKVGSAPLTPGSGNTATATLSTFTPTAPGTYCFRAEYTADPNYSGSSDGSSGECFIVKATSTTTSKPAQDPITLGASNADTATVTGNAAGGSPSGTVDFYVCGPPGSVSGCATGGTKVGSAPLTPGSGNTATATLSTFTPTAPGTYCFRADYRGDTANYDGSSSPGECFTVGKASSRTGSTPQTGSILLGASNTDTATVTGNTVGGSPTGTVDFYLCGPPGSVSGCATGGTKVGSAQLSPGTTGNTATADSPAFTPTSAGTWCVRADYLSDTNYDHSSSPGECFTVGKASSRTGSTPQTGSILLGASNTDTATVTGNTPGGSPTGTVDFFVCGPLGSRAGCPDGGTEVGSAQLSPGTTGDTATATSPTFTATSAGTYCFRAYYAGDGGQYTSSSDGSPQECFDVPQAPSTIASTPQQGAVRVRTPNSDTVTVTGAANAKPPSGTVSFRICGPQSSRSGCAAGGAVLGTASLTPGSGNTATASSPSFTPNSPGTWCFGADYLGDGNYLSSRDGSSGECFTVAMSEAPLATIASPHANATYRQGQIVAASYTCDEAPDGPGVASCAGTVGNGASIDTTSLGPHTFSVTARSYDGLSTTVADGYRVAAPPLVAISSPAQGATYTRGQSVGVTFSCAEGAFGPGLSVCSGPTAFATSKTGTYAFTVTASSTDGQGSTRTVYFRVVLPSNRFKVSRLRRRRDGRVTFQLTVPSAGAVSVLETASGPASRRRRPARWVIARLRMTPRKAGAMQVTVTPNARGKSIAYQSVAAAAIRLVVTYTPLNGTSRSATFSGPQIRS